MTTWPTLDKPPGDQIADARPVNGQGFAKPFVRDDGDTRSLHFTLDGLQRRMSKPRPQR